jgi:hypothetical protein
MAIREMMTRILIGIKQNRKITPGMLGLVMRIFLI